MRVVLQYFDGCPHWQLAARHLSEAVQRAAVTTVSVEYQLVDTPEEARRIGFQGSPTILVDGQDAFAPEEPAVGLACRVYTTETGPCGAPSVVQLEALFPPRGNGDIGP